MTKIVYFPPKNSVGRTASFYTFTTPFPALTGKTVFPLPGSTLALLWYVVLLELSRDSAPHGYGGHYNGFSRELWIFCFESTPKLDIGGSQSYLECGSETMLVNFSPQLHWHSLVSPAPSVAHVVSTWRWSFGNCFITGVCGFLNVATFHYIRSKMSH